MIDPVKIDEVVLTGPFRTLLQWSSHKPLLRMNIVSLKFVPFEPCDSEDPAELMLFDLYSYREAGKWVTVLESTNLFLNIDQPNVFQGNVTNLRTYAIIFYFCVRWLTS